MWLMTFGTESSAMNEVPFEGKVGPEELSQMAYVASMHYRERKTRIEIANRLGMSRFKVGRLLEKALESGVIRLEISSPRDIDLEISVALRSEEHTSELQSRGHLV